MPTYRFYRMSEDGRILSGDWVEADDVKDAEHRIRAACDDDQVHFEIWEGHELRGHFPCRCKDDPADA